MSKFLFSFGRWSYRTVWPMLLLWVIIVAALGGLTAGFAKPPSSNFAMPEMDSTITQQRMQERFGATEDATAAPTGTIVVEAKDGAKLTDPKIAGEVDAMLQKLQQTQVLKDPETLVNPVMAAGGLEQQMRPQMEAQQMQAEQIDANIAALSPVSPDGSTGTISVTFDAPEVMEIPASDRDAVVQILDDASSEDLAVSYQGNAFSSAGTSMDMSAETIGMIVAAIVLLVTFGSLVAAGVPLISAIIGVATGLLAVFLCTVFTDAISDITPMLASMIGIAVGIDYSLFIVARFRNELIASSGLNDLSPKELAAELKKMDKNTRAKAMGMALGTAGSSVIFAGITVLIALAALSIINIPFLTTMALAAAGTVALAVLVSLSFVPAFVGLLGTKIFAARIPGPTVPDPEDEKPTMGLKWVRRIRKRPILALAAVVVVLGALAIPAAGLRLAMPTDATAKPDTAQRIANDTVADKFGPGRNAPMIAFVDTQDVPQENRMRVYGQALMKFNTMDGVTNAQIVQLTDNQDAAQILITPTTGATDEQTTETLNSIRDWAPEFESQTGANYGVTGVTPIFDDISQRLSDVLVPYIAIVLGLAFIVLLLVFRSIWVPLIAALGFALSVAASFGATVLVFQEGALGIIADPQPILSFLPIMLIGLTFGLAMDYQVFLVTRMREGWAHGKTAGNATANGFKHGARVVTAAALIMISVFAAFMLVDEPFIKTMGFALAVAVLFDAFLIRMTLIPATMFLLGERAWWLPRWLDKILPKIDVEGEALLEHREASNPRESTLGVN